VSGGATRVAWRHARHFKAAVADLVDELRNIFLPVKGVDGNRRASDTSIGRGKRRATRGRRFMFGAGKRKRYNGVVDVKLNNEYQIDTQNGPGFPGTLYYLGLIDNAWKSEMSEDEAALYIATLYCCGLVKKGDRKEAVNLIARISSVAPFGVSKGLISQERWDRFAAAIREAEEKGPGAAGTV
jgi:hypothetical protein